MRPITAVLSLVLLAGCRSATPSVRLQGEPVAIAWLAGEWVGEYRGAAAGRSGSISFYLPSGTDSLYGDVTMLTSAGQPMMSADVLERHRLHVRSAQSLRIDFVSVGGGTVTGTLEPYVSPDCGCVVTTTFTGRITGDTIDGVFVTRAPSGLLLEGAWQVTRRRTTRP